MKKLLIAATLILTASINLSCSYSDERIEHGKQLAELDKLKTQACFCVKDVVNNGDAWRIVTLQRRDSVMLVHFHPAYTPSSPKIALGDSIRVITREEMRCKMNSSFQTERCLVAYNFVFDHQLPLLETEADELKKKKIN